MLEQSPRDAPLLAPTGAGAAAVATSDTAMALGAPEEAAGVAGPAAAYERPKLGLAFWLPVVWIVLLVAGALLAPVLTAKGLIADPNRIDLQRKYSLANGRNWLGADHLGRDQLARLVWGARVSLPVGFASVALGLSIGGTIGLLTGYLKGWVDNVFMAIMDIVLAFPALLLALSIVTFMDRKDVPTISLAIGLIGIPAVARLVRASTLSVREREFVLASRALGARHGRIVVREILPNVVPPVLSFAVIGVAVAIAGEAYLAFVGVSVPLPTATWGGMILDANASNGLEEHPFQVFLPCVVLVLTIVALYLIGERIGRLFDVREQAL